MFDRFRQGDSTPTKGKQGLGLGLAIAALMASPGKYDVLLADVEMLDEDGFGLIR